MAATENVMRNKFELEDYEPVKPSRSRRYFASPDTEAELSPVRALKPRVVADVPHPGAQPLSTSVSNAPAQANILSAISSPLKRGHSLTYLGLFIFTFLVYFRPYELFPSLAWLSRSALVVALLTLAVFIPTQLGLENRITANLREVKLGLGLLLTGLLSIPLAIDPAQAWHEFSDTFIRFRSQVRERDGLPRRRANSSANACDSVPSASSRLR